MHMGMGILIYVAAEGGLHSHAQDSYDAMQSQGTSKGKS